MTTSAGNNTPVFSHSPSPRYADYTFGVAGIVAVPQVREWPISTDAAPLADVGFRGNADVLEYHRDGVGVVMWAITTALFRRLSGPRRRDLFRLDRETLHVGAGQDGTVCHVSAVTVFTKSMIETAVTNSHLTTGAEVSAAGERASVVALRGCYRPDATPVPFYVGCFILARNFARPGASIRFSRLRFKGSPSFGMTF